MRSDLDRLMRERGLAGVIVLAHDRYCPAFYWCTGQKIHHGVYFRAADGRAHLVVDPMERDQAALAGCEWSTYAQHGFLAMIKSASSQAEALAQLIAKIAAEMQIEGRVAFSGEAPLGFSYAMLSQLAALAPKITVDASAPDVIAQAMMTKEESELESIRRASKGAVAAMNAVRTYLGSLRRKGDALTDGTHDVVTRGHVRALIHRVFAEHRLAEDGESIVSQGRDAGVPHNRGNDAEPVRTGESIIVDIFPGEAGGGYHTDMTRTFCVGKAPDALRAMYAQCREAFDAAMTATRGGALCRSLQDLTCDIFERQGHATLRTNASAVEGYVHSLGHGVGLAVHEGPGLRSGEQNKAVLEPGHVVSIEPGLYYPSRGMGMRIEDLVAVRADGSIENLTECSYELEVGADV
ncbi:MAG: aminopeptidase P family protein [Candidatus Eisenbacteria bacterium]|uniref:Aminopeptidase P family protein n=1 Tax=Eiseniibacteriota bacterium TaxID=2212470 RepID=A0A933SDP7_UNCEI|nr:aminopeptidase P family protein [Candidatus Eisenbacteria bacterium]